MPTTTSQTAPSNRPYLRGYVAAMAAAAMVLGGHLWMVKSAGSPVPVHDQWLAEAEMLYVPLVEERLTLDAIVHPHAEHRIVPTRLLALALFKLNHHVWDVRLQMTVNAFLAAILVALIVVMASRQLGQGALIAFAALAGILFASPLFYGNALWGFQSQFYLMLLFSVAHLDLVLRQRVLSIPWMIGIGCALLAWISMGSGFFSAVILGLMAGWNLVRGRRGEERRTALINFFVHAAICGLALYYSPMLTAVKVDWPATLHTLVHCLSWPGRYYTSWGAWVWLPFILFLGSLLRRTNISKNDQVVGSPGTELEFAL